MLVKIAVGFLVAFLSLFTVCTLAVLQGGVGSVYVNNEDVTLWLPVPMIAADLGLWFVPDEELEKIRLEMEPVKEFVLAGFNQLESIPDSTLVQVNTTDESVLVMKRGSDLVIDVESREDGKVYIEMPLHSLERILRKVSG